MWLENILAHAHLGRGCTQIKYSSQRMAQQIVNQIERHKFCLNDWFTKSSRTEIQTCKVQERTFGRPCIAEKRKTQTTLLSKNPKLTNRLSIRLCFSHSTCYLATQISPYERRSNGWSQQLAQIFHRSSAFWRPSYSQRKVIFSTLLERARKIFFDSFSRHHS